MYRCVKFEIIIVICMQISLFYINKCSNKIKYVINIDTIITNMYI